jgi:ferredoxin-type protein NapH
MRPGVQWLRHGVQFAVLLAIIAVPLLAQYRVLLARNQIESVRADDTESAARTVMLTVDGLLRDSTSVEAEESSTRKQAALVETLGRVQGNHWSAKVFGLSWTDPLAAFESMSAGRKVTLAVLIALVLPVALTVLLGRVFCSWICPAGLLFDVADKVRSWLPGSRQRRDIQFWRGNKYVLLVAGLAVSFVVGVPLLGYFYPPALMGREIGHTIKGFFEGLGSNSHFAGGFILTGASVLLLALVFIEVFVSRRMWCRYFCPGGALYSLLGRKRVVRLQNESSVCTGCTECVPACPMGLNPMKNQFGQECDLCLECRTACQPAAIRFKHPLSRAAKTVKQGRAA